MCPSDKLDPAAARTLSCPDFADYTVALLSHNLIVSFLLIHACVVLPPPLRGKGDECKAGLARTLLGALRVVQSAVRVAAMDILRSPR